MKKLIAILFLIFFPAVSYAGSLTFSTTAGRFSLGSYYGAGIDGSGHLFRWGGNNYANLGDDSYTAMRTPNQLGTDTWTAIVATSEHTRGIKTAGSLWAWGKNEYGQLGDGTTTNRTSPVQIGSATNWKSVWKGIYSSYAIDTSDKLWVWGDNTRGQLGISTTDSCVGTNDCQKTPVKLSDTDTYTMACGGYGEGSAGYSILLKSDGTVWGSGHNTEYELGDGTTTQRTAFTQIATGFASIACGYEANAGIKTNGTLWVWGYNYRGQYGDGTTTSVSTPKQIGSATWLSVAVGYDHTVAVKSDGTLWAWGRNNKGQLGIGTTASDATPVASPAQVGSASDWTQAFAGAYFSAAMKSDGSVYTWGMNENQYEHGYCTGQNTVAIINTPTLLRYWNHLYVSVAGGSTKTGAYNDPYDVAALSSKWAGWDSGTDNTVLYFIGGTNYTGSFYIRHDSTANYLYIRPCSASPNTSSTGCTSKVVFSRSGLSGDTPNIYLGSSSTNLTSNIIIDGETTEGAGTRNMQIIPGTFGSGSASAGLIYEGSRSSAHYLSNSHIRYLEVTGARCEHNCVTDGREPSHSGNGIYLKEAANCSISYSYFTDNCCDADISIAPVQSLKSFGLNSIHHNTITASSINYVKSLGSLDIYNNTFDVSTAYIPYDVLHALAWYSEGDEGLDYFRIWNNMFDSADQCIFLENNSLNGLTDRWPIRHILIYNNLFKRTQAPFMDGVEAFQGKPISFKNVMGNGETYNAFLDRIIVANNTFINLNYAFILTSPDLGTGTLTNMTVANNIYYVTDVNPTYLGSSTFYGPGDWLTNNTMSYANKSDLLTVSNIINNANGWRAMYRVPGSAWAVYTTVANFNTATGQTNYNAIPPFAETTNYTLSASTSSIGSGTNLSSAITAMFGQDPGGLSWNFDKAGTARGSAWDIGAYQYLTGGSSTTSTVSGGVISGGQLK